MIKSCDIIDLHLKPLLEWYLYDIKVYIHRYNEQNNIKEKINKYTTIQNVSIPVAYDISHLNQQIDT